MTPVENKIINPISIGLASPVRRRALNTMRVHVWLIAAFIRVLMMFGYVVVLVGRCRSGKTLILERATPGKIICKLNERMQTGVAPTLSAAEIPSGHFSIDEAAQLEPTSLLKVIADLSERPFAISMQHPNDLLNYGLEKVGALGSRRRVILTLS
jgi:hypothetical protein